MDTYTARRLSALNTRFYREHSASFSSSRKAPWPGWQACLAHLREELPDPGKELLVFDLACGNLRFEHFLLAELPEYRLNCFGVDNCDDLLPASPLVSYQHLDVLDALFQGRELTNSFEAPPCSVAVSFGFMHHIPLPELRRAVLNSLIEQVCPGGYVITTFWQFMNDAGLRAKALALQAEARAELGLKDLDEDDFLLSWNNIPGAYRYCHNFSEAEIDELLESVSAQASLHSRFSADGRTNTLNTYVILKRHAYVPGLAAEDTHFSII